MKRLLIAGFGDVARRALPLLEGRFEVTRLSRRNGFDLDRPETLELPQADAMLHCAPPPAEGRSDPRTGNLLSVLEARRILPARVVYVSTSGVYGDCGGEWIDESRPVRPQSDRGWRRVDAERRLTDWCAERGLDLVILRAPGIYASDRLPIERVRAGTPVLRPEDDVYTNHVHAEDLAAMACHALDPGAATGIFNASDDTDLRMGDWMDAVADYAGLPRPPRISREEACIRIPAPLYSFMCESRRLDNGRIKRDLRYVFRYPDVHAGLADAGTPGLH